MAEIGPLNPAPSLPSSLLISYSSLTPELQRLFSKVFRYLWGVVQVRRFDRRGGVLYAFWAVDILRHRLNLSPSQLSALTYIYALTNKGVDVIHSDRIYYSGVVLPGLTLHSKHMLLTTLKAAGYLSRSTRDPSHPYNSRFHAPQYIKLTYKGVQVIEGIEKDLYKLVLNTSLDDLTGRNKKP